MKNKVGSFFFGLFFTLFFRVESYLFSTPALVALILHFVLDISLWWFFGMLIAWLCFGTIRYLVILFARRCSTPTPYRENKNIYSKTNADFFKK